MFVIIYVCHKTLFCKQYVLFDNENVPWISACPQRKLSLQIST